jgi:hypothetical protein
MNRLFGRPCLSPDGDQGGTEDRGEETPTTIKVGNAEISQADLDDLINGDAAGSTKVTIQGRTVTLKEMREGWKNQPNAQKLLEDGRAELEARSKKLDEREAVLAETMASAGKSQLTDIANAINAAVGGGPKNPMATREQATKYLTDLVETDAKGTIATMVAEMFDRGEASAKALKALEEKFEALKADNERSRTRDRVADQARQIVQKIQALHEKDPDFPLYNPRGRDAFSLLVSEGLRAEEPLDWLDGKIGIDMEPVEVARLANAALDKEAEQRTTRKTEAAKRKAAADAAEPRATGGDYRVSSETQKELDAARALMKTDPVAGREALKEAYKKIAASG